MSPDRLAEAAIETLCREISSDAHALDRILERLVALRPRLAGAVPDPADVMAAAAFLHHAYTAVESIHERVIRHVDGARPSGDRWHSDLLTLAALPIEGVRPAIISEESRAELARFLRFRHFFRHAYRIDLLWKDVRPLFDDAEQVFTSVRREIDAFVAALRTP